ncbi:MAG: threonylcarbamoyl-AMP synthase [Gemmatimonadetes bacterium]|nr:threonylcarbamoyl-AMP synthase [Gemmatimonadota bacterium]
MNASAPTHGVLRPIDPAHPDEALLQEAAALLRGGGLVAFPTETVYGLGAHALDAAAVRRIFSAKGRPAFNPLIVHVPDVATAKTLVTAWPEVADRLAARWWPGPLTLVLPKRAMVPDEVTAGRASVAIRIPAHPVARALLAAVGLPIAAPSANRFTELSPVTGAQVARSLGDRVAMILDGGRTPVGIESTVVDCTTTPPTLLRPGTITRAELEVVVGPLQDPAPVTDAEAPRAAPGMIARHYAPRAMVRLLDADALARAVATERQRGTEAPATREAEPVSAGANRPAAITWSEAGRAAAADLHVHLHLDASPLAYAAELYAALHAVDDAGCGTVLVEQVPMDPAWDGIRDRLARAAHP